MNKVDETLQRFALRARRIAAHSLATDREKLAGLADFSISGTLSLDGTFQARRKLPDEEAFESLAARLRPLLLGSESVYYVKVLDAIESVLDRQEPGTAGIDALRERTDQLRRAWSSHDEKDPRALRYSTQTAKIDGSESTPQVSDSQLALAWLYGDLVHVDVKGQKKPGTLLPIKERYSGAVSYFSSAALLCAETFDVVIHLADLELFELGEQTMNIPVTVGVDELVSTGVAFFAPIDTEMPVLDVSSREIPEGFRQLTVTDLKRMEKENHVQVRLEAEDGTALDEYEAAVIWRHAEDGHHEWHTLVAGCVIYKLSFYLGEDGPVSSRCEVVVAKLTTNRMALNKSLFEGSLMRSAVMKFIVAGQEFFSLAHSNAADGGSKAIDISIDSLQDLVTIENVTGKELPLATNAAENWERAELRRIRLLWEGKVVPFTQGPLNITAEAGTVPEVLIVPAGTRTFAGIEYPTPGFIVRHPLMMAKSVQPVPDSDPPQHSMQMVVPLKEPFVAWVPERCAVESDLDLLNPTPWGLLHFDQSPFLGEWAAEPGLTAGNIEEPEICNG